MSFFLRGERNQSRRREEQINILLHVRLIEGGKRVLTRVCNAVVSAGRRSRERPTHDRSRTTALVRVSLGPGDPPEQRNKGTHAHTRGAEKKIMLCS